MGAEIDSLDIQIKTTVDRASNAIDKLIGNLDSLSSSLGGINEKSLTGFANGIDKITGASAKLGSVKSGDFTRLSNQIGRVTSSTGRAAKATRSFSQVAGGFYANYFLAVRGLKKAWNSVESSMDFLETVNYFEVAMRKLGDNAVATWDGIGHDSAEAYAKSFSERAKQLTAKMTGYEIDEGGNTTYAGIKNLGMNPESVMNYQAMFAQVSESIGVAEESALNFSTALTMLGADWASLRNITFEESWGKFASALAGQSRAVRALGIDITNATLQEYAYKYGLTQAVSEMNQATKAQLRLLAILDQSKVAFGDLANTMESPANQLRMLKQNFANLARTIGNLFLPVVSAVLPYINGLVMALQRLFSWIGGLLGIKFNSINSSIGGMDSGIEDLVGGTEDEEDSLNKANAAAKKLKNTLLGFDEINALNDNSDSSGGSTSGSGIGGGSALLDEEIANALEAYQKAWDEAFDRMENKAQDISDRICNAFKRGDYEGIGTYISTGITNALESIQWDKVYEVTNKFGTGLAEFLNGLITPELFGAVGKTIANSLNTAVYLALSFGETLEWENIGLSIASGINKFFDNFDFEAFAETINVWVQGLFKTLKTAVANIDWWEVFKGINDFFKNLDISTVAIVIGVLTIKKICSVIFGEHIIKSIASAIGGSLSSSIAAVMASKLGLDLAEGAGMSAAFLELGKNMANIFFIGFKALLGNKAAESALAFMNPIILKITGIASVIGGAATAVVNFFVMWQDGFSWLNEALMVLGLGIAAIGAVILGVPAGIAAAVAGVVAAIATVAVVVKEHWEEICDFFKGIWDKICEIWEPVANWFEENVIEPVVGFFQGLFTRVGQIFEGLWIIVQAIWIIVSDWFNEYVITPVVGFFKGLWEDVSGFFLKLWTDIQAVWSVVSGWFDKNIITPVSDAFKTACDSIGGFFNSLWSGIRGGVVGAMNSVISGIEAAINWIVSGINKIIGGFNKVVSWAAKVAETDWGGVDKVEKVRLGRISMYEQGGFPETGQLFLARENGLNEMIGRIGNHSAVANNDQIVESIRGGVKDAMMEVMMAFAGNMGGGNSETPIIENVIKCDSETLYHSVQKGKDKHDRRYHVVTEF